ncbi:urease accessory protein UreD [Actibacterium lipolyticum]|uniref:Urease accessory protein UreD n=1 Tax=Actibacterium lipolyticum TaxID=1524263 RepID=A0A238JVM2_9RHOB|nr:urease accessory protein UreD [Actibacterium lipolyticum]SMX34237.1 Urease accessory protein UreD [Actibacterium lipolyticum]
MFDRVDTIVSMQRTRGRAEVALNAAPNGARLARLHQSGSAKAMLPKVHSPRPEIVFLNTAGGLTGGDKMRYALTLAPGAKATATTQTAERAYASSGGVAELDVEMSVGAGGALDWLPQETILFEDSALSRRTTMTLQGDARLLMVEMVTLGRAAMGETLSNMFLQDHRSVTRDGTPVLIEPLRMTTETLARRGARAGLRGARAFATLALIAPGAEDALGPLRAGLDHDGVEVAASAWNGKCVARFIGADATPLRQAVARAITTLRGGPLPRVWQI